MKNTLRVFTLQEANALIPVLEELLSGMMKKKEDFERRHDYYFMNELLSQVESNRSGSVPANGLVDEARELDDCAAAFQCEIAKVRKLGCVVRRLDQGVVEFLAKRGGQWVYLCWRAGQKQITHYRRLYETSNDLHVIANETA